MHLRVDGLAVQLRSAHAAFLRVVYADERAARAQNRRVDIGADNELKPLRNLEEVAAGLGQAAHRELKRIEQVLPRNAGVAKLVVEGFTLMRSPFVTLPLFRFARRRRR